MTRVFVSHATADTAFAERFSNDLRAFGVDAWLDSSHMGPGDFVSRISAALQRDVLILVLTPAAIASPWVQQEMNAAITRANQKLMRSPIVVLAAPCPLEQIPALWTVYHRYDATQDYMPALAAIVRELDLTPSASPAAPVSPAPSTPQPSPGAAAGSVPAPTAAAPLHGLPERVETARAEPIPSTLPPYEGRTPQLPGVVASANSTFTSAQGTISATRPTDDGTSHRHVGAYWALAGGAAVVALAALASLAIPQVLAVAGVLGALAVVPQSALVVTASIRSIGSTRYHLRYIALVNACEAALGLFVLWLILVSTGVYNGGLVPTWVGSGIIALVLLAIVPTLRVATPQPRWQSVAVVYGLTIASLGAFLFIVDSGFYALSDPLGISYIALALLGTVFTAYVAIRQRQWAATVGIIAAMCFVCLVFRFVSLSGDTVALLEGLLPVAPLLYGLFANTKRLP